MMKKKFAVLAYPLLAIAWISLIHQSCTRQNLCNCDADLMDSRDNQIYEVTPYDGLCWMKENLRYVPSANQGERFCYDDKPECDTYGGLYTWATATQENNGIGVRGICPEGWRLPTKEEVEKLTKLSQEELTAVCPANNESIFSISFAGYRTAGQGTYKGQIKDNNCGSDLHTYFHTSNIDSDTSSYFLSIGRQEGKAGTSTQVATRKKGTANSIRCVCEI